MNGRRWIGSKGSIEMKNLLGESFVEGGARAPATPPKCSLLKVSVLAFKVGGDASENWLAAVGRGVCWARLSFEMRAHPATHQGLFCMSFLSKRMKVVQRLQLVPITVVLDGEDGREVTTSKKERLPKVDEDSARVGLLPIE
ncbi:hypothetical protein MUK42_35803 [Musa troglodytarum]|uniref:Uncharacterized protein n=1 Tax=Musa troglodytarum TaxID=320322 RepID=A0A9E7JX79_9LILI|nr:hypothetical protein MUK42_35803 [Musa troglodytarum]